MNLTPPYRVIAGRTIVDALDRVLGNVSARRAVGPGDQVLVSFEESTTISVPPGLSPTDADALAHELVRVLNSHTRIVDALRDLLDWGRSNTSPLDANTPHQLLVEAAGALEDEQAAAIVDADKNLTAERT